MKLTKAIIDGKEYDVTDKQAQQLLDVLSGKMDSLEESVSKLREQMKEFVESFEWLEL